MAHLALGLSASRAAQVAPTATVSDFKLCLSPDRMLQLAKQTALPGKEEYQGLAEASHDIASRGINLKVLQELQNEWNTTFDWGAEQESLNKSVMHLVFFPARCSSSAGLTRT